MTDHLWYKDAVFYELHVRCFYDGNNDGIGDFVGLQEKLPYIRDLGVNGIWLLPFFNSPLRDDGYDVSDFTSVHPHYGSLEQFQSMLEVAHRLVSGFSNTRDRSSSSWPTFPGLPSPANSTSRNGRAGFRRSRSATFAFRTSGTCPIF